MAVGRLTCCTTTSVKLSCKAMIISCSPVRNRSDSTSFWVRQREGEVGYAHNARRAREAKESSEHAIKESSAGNAYNGSKRATQPRRSNASNVIIKIGQGNQGKQGKQANNEINLKRASNAIKRSEESNGWKQASNPMKESDSSKQSARLTGKLKTGALPITLPSILQVFCQHTAHYFHQYGQYPVYCCEHADTYQT